MGLNPQGNRNGDGPPDLEEVMRKLNQRLAALTGGRNNRSGGGGGLPGMGGGLSLLLVVVLVIWLASGFYIVNPSERGVELRFGKHTTTTKPGPHWHLPYPVGSVEIVDISQVRTVEVGYRGTEKNKMLKESLMLTDDENIIDIQFAVQYVLNDPAAYLFNNRMDQIEPENFVRQAAESVMREVVGKSRMDFVLYEGREQLAAAATSSIQELLDRYKSGIMVSKVTMQNAQPPEQVQQAFDDAVKAGQDKERLRNEGEAYAKDVIERAEGQAERLRQEAEGYRERVIASAEGDASRFEQILIEYRKAPEVTRERLYLDAMQNVLSKSSKVMIDQKQGNSMLYLPLDKMMQRSSTAQDEQMPRNITIDASNLNVKQSESLDSALRRTISRNRGGE